MTWPWRNTDPAGAAAAPAPAPAPSLDKLIEAADLLRDARRWAEAAQAYEAVVERASARSPIWVQLGHARKESGDLKGAEAAYRQALALAPEIADTHVQLGHALKLQGARGAAIAAYARALRVDRTCTPALTELIALGEGWEAEQASEVGAHMLGDLLQATQQMRATLSRLEQALPDMASLINVPVARSVSEPFFVAAATVRGSGGAVGCYRAGPAWPGCGHCTAAQPGWADRAAGLGHGGQR
ncbi:MAG TPA: tetratricopeptide repeat protein [Rhodopila sp.]|nr:tetratricopeptide repeat protein [Rhodopila sp.]